MYIQDFLYHFLLVSLSILFLKCFFFKLSSFLSNIYSCIKTYITRDCSWYGVCSTFKDTLVIIWLLFHVVGNIAHLKNTFQKLDTRIWEGTITFRKKKWKLCLIYMWSYVFGFMVLKVLDFCTCSKVEVFCVSINDSLKLDFPLVQLLHTFDRCFGSDSTAYWLKNSADLLFFF